MVVVVSCGCSVDVVWKMGLQEVMGRGLVVPGSLFVRS